MFNKWELVIEPLIRNGSGDQHWPLYRCEAPGGWLYKVTISPAGIDVLQYVPEDGIDQKRGIALDNMYNSATEENVTRTWAKKYGHEWPLDKSKLKASLRRLDATLEEVSAEKEDDLLQTMIAGATYPNRDNG